MIYRYKSLTFVFGNASRSALYDDIATYRAAQKVIGHIFPALSLKKIIGLKQIHGTDIIDANNHCCSGDELFLMGDGLITSYARTGLMVLTADCMPVILYAENKNIVSVVHAGWRGAVAGIVSGSIKMMQVEYGVCSDEIKIFIGPHARSCCYTIQSDVANIIQRAAYQQAIVYGHDMKLDLMQVLKMQMMVYNMPAANIIESYALCTMCDEQYCSFRREKTKLRNINIAYLNE